MASSLSFFFASMVILAYLAPTWAELDSNYYDNICPDALPTIRKIVEQAVVEEMRMGASLLRLHFHDCFVNGCDGSILLDDTPTFTGEKTAEPNKNSVRGFDVIDRIKAAVDEVCYGSVVSCADILAVAARDSIVALGGSSYKVQVGRRDARTASKSAADNNLPSPFSDLSTLLSNFQSNGLTLKDLVVLSGAHTIGKAKCTAYRGRLYNETSNIDGVLAKTLRSRCPLSGGSGSHAPLDAITPTDFDTGYYDGLLQKRGLLHSDQQLFKDDGSRADELVKHYSENPDDFFEDFGLSMLKMGAMSPLTGYDGEIRRNCRSVN